MKIVLDGRLKTDRSVLALGMFDGVHIGHQVLVKKAHALAQAADAPLIACTFLQHPMELIAPEKAPALLTTFEERAALLQNLGVDYLYAMPFDHQVMNQLPEEYVGELVRHFHPTDIVCGYNHSFGKKGGGSPALLDALGGALGFRVSVVPKITYQGQDVSSSVIRQLLSAGDAALARHMLDRPYQRMGIVSQAENDHLELVMPANGKQMLPAGKYRALITLGDKNLPVLLTISTPGHGRCTLKVNMPSSSSVKISFLDALSVEHN